MAKRLSVEFKQQAIDYALSNSHESVAAIALKLSVGVGYSTLDKWIREANPAGSSKRQFPPEHEQYNAFNYALARQGYPTNIMVHSLAKQCFSGSQYCSRDFRTLLLTNNRIQSMSRRGPCAVYCSWDNAVVTESFFHTLKMSCSS